jgi:GAF domain-containing protein
MRLAFGANEKGEGEKGLRVLLESIVNCFPETAGAEYGEITLFNDKDMAFTFAAATGKERDEAFSGEQFKLTLDEGDKIFTQKVMESKNPLIINDVNDYVMSGADRDMVERLGIRSMAIFPMFAGNRFVGSISFDYGGHEHRFTQQDINGMHGLADLASLMIDYAERLVGP